MCREHAETIAEVNQDKEMLIQQNSQLKTAATEQLTQNEQLKSQVESFHGYLQTAEANLASEQAKMAAYCHTEQTYTKIQDELAAMREQQVMSEL